MWAEFSTKAAGMQKKKKKKNPVFSMDIQYIFSILNGQNNRYLWLAPHPYRSEKKNFSTMNHRKCSRLFEFSVYSLE